MLKHLTDNLNIQASSTHPGKLVSPTHHRDPWTNKAVTHLIQLLLWPSNVHNNVSYRLPVLPCPVLCIMLLNPTLCLLENGSTKLINLCCLSELPILLEEAGVMRYGLNNAVYLTTKALPTYKPLFCLLKCTSLLYC